MAARSHPPPATLVDRVELFIPPDEWSVEQIVETIDSMTHLRVIQVTSAGVDWILPSLPRGVTLCSGRGIHDVSVSEWVMAAILAMQRALPQLRDQQQARRWVRAPAQDLADATVLILGHGSIGRAVEARLRPFGTRLLRVARRPREGVAATDALPDLLPQADAVVVLLPLTPETEGIVDARFMRHMKTGALLVNAARGRLVVTDALLEALRARRIRAALDVTDPEPLPEDHPLWSAPGLFITPHVAGDSVRLPERSLDLVRDQVRRYAAGEPLANVVGEY